MFFLGTNHSRVIYIENALELQEFSRSLIYLRTLKREITQGHWHVAHQLLLVGILNQIFHHRPYTGFACSNMS